METIISILLISIIIMAHGYILECHIDDLHKDLIKELEDLKKQLNTNNYE